MNPPGTINHPRYELRVPAGGMGQPNTRLTLLAWGVGSILLGLTVSFLLVQGQFRVLVLVLLSFLGLMSLAPRRGVYILTAFLPFMYFIRRTVLAYQEYSARDPILLFPVITTLAMVVGVILFYGPQIFHYFRHSSLLKACVLLLGLFILQIFNPLQGGVLVGLGGAIFLVVPMLWLFLGLITPREDMARILKMVLVIGFITSLYGIYQRYFGLSDVELYELKAKHFLKSFGGVSGVRIMSTFSGLGDFSGYLTVSSFLAFAYFWRSKRALVFLLLLALQLYAMLYTALRTSFLVTFFSIVMLIILAGKDSRRIVVRGMIAFVIVAVLYSFTYRYDARSVYTERFSSDPFVVHTLSGITHPTQESTFQIRLRSWSYIVTSTLFQYPVGRGLGSTTVAARKFEGGEYYETDSYFFGLFYGSGLVAPILFLAIVYILLRDLLRMCLAFPREYLYRIGFGLICGVLLSSVFGLSLRDSILGPVAWLVIGWIIKEKVDRQAEAGDSLPAASVRAPLVAAQPGRV